MSQLSTHPGSKEEHFSLQYGEDEIASDELMEMFTISSFDNFAEPQRDYSSLMMNMDLSSSTPQLESDGFDTLQESPADANQNWERNDLNNTNMRQDQQQQAQPNKPVGHSHSEQLEQRGRQKSHSHEQIPSHSRESSQTSSRDFSSSIESPSSSGDLPFHHRDQALLHQSGIAHAGLGIFGSSSDENTRLASPNDTGGSSPISGATLNHSLHSGRPLSRQAPIEERAKIGSSTHRITKKSSRSSLRTRKSRVGFEDEIIARSPLVRNDSFSSDSSNQLLSPRASSASLIDGAQLQQQHFGLAPHLRPNHRAMLNTKSKAKSYADLRSSARMQASSSSSQGSSFAGKSTKWRNEISKTLGIQEEHPNSPSQLASARTPLRRLQKATSTSQLRTPTLVTGTPTTPAVGDTAQVTPSTIVASSATVKKRYKRQQSATNGATSPTPATRATSSTSTTLVAEANDSSPAKGVFSNRKSSAALLQSSRRKSSIIPEMTSAMTQFQVELNITPSVASAQAALTSAQASLANINTNPLNIPARDNARSAPKLTPGLQPSHRQKSDQQWQLQQDLQRSQQPQFRRRAPIKQLPPSHQSPRLDSNHTPVSFNPPPRTSSRNHMHVPPLPPAQGPGIHGRIGYSLPAVPPSTSTPSGRQPSPDTRMIQLAPTGEMHRYGQPPQPVRLRSSSIRWPHQQSQHQQHHQDLQQQQFQQQHHRHHNNQNQQEQQQQPQQPPPPLPPPPPPPQQQQQQQQQQLQQQQTQRHLQPHIQPQNSQHQQRSFHRQQQLQDRPPSHQTISGRPPPIVLADQYLSTLHQSGQRTRNVNAEPMSAPAAPMGATHNHSHYVYERSNRHSLDAQHNYSNIHGSTPERSMAAAAAAVATCNQSPVDSSHVQMITPPMTFASLPDRLARSPFDVTDNNGSWSSADHFSSDGLARSHLNQTMMYHDNKDTLSQATRLDLDAPPFEWSEGLGGDDSWEIMGYLKTDYK